MRPGNRIRLGGHQTSRKRRDAGDEIIEFATPQKEIDRYLARKKKEMQRIENEKELTRILLDNHKDVSFYSQMNMIRSNLAFLNLLGGL